MKKASIEDEIAAHLAWEISKEIDQQILTDIQQEIEKDKCMKRGWVVAPFTSDKFSSNTVVEIAVWIHTNATGEYKIFGREFWFQRKQDLTAFCLRWA